VFKKFSRVFARDDDMVRNPEIQKTGNFHALFKHNTALNTGDLICTDGGVEWPRSKNNEKKDRARGFTRVKTTRPIFFSPAACRTLPAIYEVVQSPSSTPLSAAVKGSACDQSSTIQEEDDETSWYYSILFSSVRLGARRRADDRSIFHDSSCILAPGDKKNPSQKKHKSIGCDTAK